MRRGCLCVHRSVAYECAGTRVCVCVCVQCAPATFGLHSNPPLCPHQTIQLNPSVTVSIMMTVGLWRCVADDAIMCLCAILATCHSSSLLQASSVNAQLFTVSPAHHLASLNCFGFEAGEIESTYAHTQTHTDSFGFSS